MNQSTPTQVGTAIRYALTQNRWRFTPLAAVVRSVQVNIEDRHGSVPAGAWTNPCPANPPRPQQHQRSLGFDPAAMPGDTSNPGWWILARHWELNGPYIADDTMFAATNPAALADLGGHILTRLTTQPHPTSTPLRADLAPGLLAIGLHPEHVMTALGTHAVAVAATCAALGVDPTGCTPSHPTVSVTTDLACSTQITTHT